MLLGLSGKMGSGKDFLYEYLLRDHGWYKWSFAHPMKAMGVGFGFTYDELTRTKPQSVREWMQKYGTEQHRDVYGEHFWLDVASYYLRTLNDMGIHRVCFTDVRFPNEVAWVQDQGGHVIRLEGRGGGHDGTQEHSSETALDGYFGFDAIVQNHDDGLDALETQIRRQLPDVLSHFPSGWWSLR